MNKNNLETKIQKHKDLVSPSISIMAATCFTGLIMLSHSAFNSSFIPRNSKNYTELMANYDAVNNTLAKYALMDQENSYVSNAQFERVQEDRARIHRLKNFYEYKLDIFDSTKAYNNYVKLKKQNFKEFYLGIALIFLGIGIPSIAEYIESKLNK